MKITSVRHIDGPNLYIYKPILMARTHLEELTERESKEFGDFNARLLKLLPGLNEHHCAKGEAGGFVERLSGGTYFGHIVEHVAIELACCAGLDVHYGKTLYADGPGIYDIVIECKEFSCQRMLLEAALHVVLQLLRHETPSIDSIVDEAKQILARTSLGPSTQAIVDEAQVRQIPVSRLNEGSLVQLGYGCRRHFVSATITDQTSSVAVDIVGDKALTKTLLQTAGVPVPDGYIVYTEEEAVAALESLTLPLVVKPFDGNQGRGVSLQLETPEQMRQAFRVAVTYSSRVIVEEYVAGHQIRVLIVDGEYVAASERVPARICGDGKHSIRQLIAIENQNPLRGTGHERPLTVISVDEIVRSNLQLQGMGEDTIPKRGQFVYLRANANLSTGGEAADITDELHPYYVSLAKRAAKQVGLDVCGIDMIVPAISRREKSPCAVVELNAAPGIRMHEFPSYGQKRHVARAIVDSLYAQGDNGRIPIVAVTGTNGKTTTVRLIAHALKKAGKVTGMTSTGGVYVDGKQIAKGDTTGPNSARMILSNPDVEAAVLEVARGGIVKGGLAYDQADVAVVTNITMDHIGQDGLDTIEDLIHIKSLVAECVRPEGTVVLNADDEHVAALWQRVSRQVAFIAETGSNIRLREHLEHGGVGYYVHHGWLVESRGNLVREIVKSSDVPLTAGGTAKFQIFNCLSAIAALRALNLTHNQIADALISFVPSTANPGRCEVYQLRQGSHVILDYGHNPDGFLQMGSWLKQIPSRRRIGVVGVPGDRANAIVEESARRLAQIFDVLVVKEDADLRGRSSGEIAGIMAGEIRKLAPSQPCEIVLSERDALRHAVQTAMPGDMVVMFYEQLQPAREILESYGAKMVDVQTLMSRPAAAVLS